MDLQHYIVHISSTDFSGDIHYTVHDTTYIHGSLSAMYLIVQFAVDLNDTVVRGAIRHQIRSFFNIVQKAFDPPPLVLNIM